MAQRNESTMSKGLLWLTTTVATGGFLFAWNTNAKITTIADHVEAHSAQINAVQMKQNTQELSIEDLKISEADTRARLNVLELKKSYR